MPITKVDGKAVGDGRLGPVTTHLREAYWDLHRDARFTKSVEYDRIG